MRHVTIAMLALMLPVAAVHADIIISSRDSHVAPGAPLELELTITNDRPEALKVDLPSPLRVKFETATAVGVLEFIPQRAGPIQVEPREFAKVRLRGSMPGEAQGTATLTPAGLDANPVVVQVDAAAPAVATAQTESRLVDKPPPIAVSVYEPVYFLVGGDDGLNAKFQISLRYRLFDDRGKLASRLPWIDDLYLSYSQTSLWDLDELSKPFTDTSYRPRFFFADYDLGRVFDGRLRIGVEAGAGHESNGKEGDESRSFNMLYVRPTFTVGDPDGLRFYVAPLIHNYIADDENPDLKDYRGYVDWLVGIGSKGGLDFWATLRKGTRSDFGSAELNLSYPLSKLSGGDLTGWVMLQYFGGYGESLLDYQRKLESQLRLGIAIAL